MLLLRQIPFDGILGRMALVQVNGRVRSTFSPYAHDILTRVSSFILVLIIRFVNRSERIGSQRRGKEPSRSAAILLCKRPLGHNSIICARIERSGGYRPPSARGMYHAEESGQVRCAYRGCLRQNVEMDYHALTRFHRLSTRVYENGMPDVSRISAGGEWPPTAPAPARESHA